MPNKLFTDGNGRLDQYCGSDDAERPTTDCSRLWNKWSEVCACEENLCNTFAYLRSNMDRRSVEKTLLASSSSSDDKNSISNSHHSFIYGNGNEGESPNDPPERFRHRAIAQNILVWIFQTKTQIQFHFPASGLFVSRTRKRVSKKFVKQLASEQQSGDSARDYSIMRRRLHRLPRLSQLSLQNAISKTNSLVSNTQTPQFDICLKSSRSGIVSLSTLRIDFSCVKM